MIQNSVIIRDNRIFKTLANSFCAPHLPSKTRHRSSLPQTLGLHLLIFDALHDRETRLSEVWPSYDDRLSGHLSENPCTGWIQRSASFKAFGSSKIASYRPPYNPTYPTWLLLLVYTLTLYFLYESNNGCLLKNFLRSLEVGRVRFITCY